MGACTVLGLMVWNGTAMIKATDWTERDERFLRRINKAEATIQRLEAEVIKLSEELVLAKAAIQRVRDEPYASLADDMTSEERQWVRGWNQAIDAVRRALAGDSDD